MKVEKGSFVEVDVNAKTIRVNPPTYNPRNIIVVVDEFEFTIASVIEITGKRLFYEITESKRLLAPAKVMRRIYNVASFKPCPRKRLTWKGLKIKRYWQVEENPCKAGYRNLILSLEKTGYSIEQYA